MKKDRGLFASIQELIRNLNAAVLMAIMCIILAQTLGRVLHFSIPWSEELSRYLFISMILLGINIGISENRMVSIDLVDAVLPEKPRWILNLFREGVGLIVSAIMFYSCFPLIRIGRFQKSPAMQLPMNFIYSLMAVGFFLAAISVLMRLFRLLCKREEER